MVIHVRLLVHDDKMMKHVGLLLLIVMMVVLVPKTNDNIKTLSYAIFRGCDLILPA